MFPIKGQASITSCLWSLISGHWLHSTPQVQCLLHCQWIWEVVWGEKKATTRLLVVHATLLGIMASCNITVVKIAITVQCQAFERHCLHVCTNFASYLALSALEVAQVTIIMVTCWQGNAVSAVCDEVFFLIQGYSSLVTFDIIGQVYACTGNTCCLWLTRYKHKHAYKH